MALYSVYLRGSGPQADADAAFIRNGFAWDAFFFGPFWLALRGLWLVAALWIAVWIMLSTLAGLEIMSSAAAWTVALLLEALLGLEANQLLERKLVRQGRQLSELIAAPAREQAEAAFFRKLDAEGGSPAPFEPRPARQAPPSHQDVIGFFPHAGGRG